MSASRKTEFLKFCTPTPDARDLPHRTQDPGPTCSPRFTASEPTSGRRMRRVFSVHFFRPSPECPRKARRRKTIWISLVATDAPDADSYFISASGATDRWRRGTQREISRRRTFAGVRSDGRSVPITDILSNARYTA
jgi:hypothetical protein